MIRLEFDRGTILVHNASELPDELKLPGARLDRRVNLWRAKASAYRDIVTVLHQAEIEYDDQARQYDEQDLELSLLQEPFPHQAEAVEAWWNADQRGVVVLPTGSGKTYVAQLLMQRARRNTLIVTPTIDLMQQWYGILGASFGRPIGLLGGGEYDVQPVTVSTYDSAYLHADRLGNRFGMLVFDECHHLPSASYAMAAESCLAPFRVGLTATPERDDGGHRHYDRLIGPVVYRREIKELAGDYLADYQTVRVSVKLTDEERQIYHQERELYREFVQANGIRFGSPRGWIQFLTLTSSSEYGRRAFQAYRTQKEIAQGSEAKIRMLEQLLLSHRHDRVLIFTNDNKTVYRISRQFLIPAITHKTKVKERHAVLQGFNEGTYPFLVTSKVLNEGVDVPAANVGIVLSGSGSVREHVQRLGRILRRAKDKEALLYELVAEDTAEEFTSSRRTQHSAYQ